MFYFIQTFGCQMNENDSNHIAAELNHKGHRHCESVEDADIIVINTCCVRENAENRALGFIGSIKHLKELNPDLIIVVCGCMAQKEGTVAMLAEKYRHVDIIAGTFAIPLIAEYIEEYSTNREKIVDIAEKYNLKERESQLTCDNEKTSYKAQVNINFGCNNFCSYCIVPYVRGRERSRNPEDIYNEITALTQTGVKEIQLLGQNVNSYGKDFSGNHWDFAQLLKKIALIPGLERIRYMTSHPRDFNRYLAETIASLDKVCPHFHLPLQSGCDRILQMMNRGYTTQEYQNKISFIRELVPDATITTDIIVGFPGETDTDFKQTLDFIKEIKFDAAYTFIYSKRSGTVAANLPGHLSEDIKKDRLQKLMDIQNPISLQQNQKLVGTIQQIMIDGISKNNTEMLSGRTPGNKIVVFSAPEKWEAGDLVKIKINSAKTWNLSGTHIK